MKNIVKLISLISFLIILSSSVYADPASLHRYDKPNYVGIYNPNVKEVAVDANNNFVFSVNSRVSFDMSSFNRMSFKTQVTPFNSDNFYYMKVYLGNELIYNKVIDNGEIDDDFIWINWPGTVTFDFYAFNKTSLKEPQDVYLILWNPELYHTDNPAGVR